MSKIDMIRGDTRTITATFVDSDGSPLDLTGGTVFFTVNASSEPTDDTAAVVSKDVSSFAAPTTGIATITLAAADTTNVTPGTYWYDCQFVSSGGVVTSLAKQKFVLKSDITRRIV
jgi:hypothetical protein